MMEVGGIRSNDSNPNCVFLSGEKFERGGRKEKSKLRDFCFCSVTDCEPTAMSDPVVIEPSRAGGLLGTTCQGHSAASLDDGIVDTAK